MKNRSSWVAAIAVAGMLLIRMVVFTVEDSESAVLLTFGKPGGEAGAAEDESEAGFRLKWPWPIQDVKVFDTRLRVLESPLEEMNTVDGQAITSTGLGAFSGATVGALAGIAGAVGGSILKRFVLRLVD